MEINENANAMTALNRTLITVTLVVAGVTAVLLMQRRAQARLSLENESMRQQLDQQAQLQAENERLSNRVAQAGDAPALSIDQRSELLRLRDEVGRLHAETQKWTRASATLPVYTVAAKIGDEQIPKESWLNAGFASPQAALQTRGWTVVNGDRDRVRESVFLTTGARKMMEQMIAAAPISEAEKKQHPELLNMTAEDAMLFPMMGQNNRNRFTGYRILSQQALAANEMLLEVETQMTTGPSRKEALKFQRLGNDWKVVIDEEMLKGDFNKMQRMKAQR